MFGFPLRVGVRVGGVGVCRVKVLVRVRVKVRFGVLLKFLPIAPPHTETKGATKRFQKKGSRTSQPLGSHLPALASRGSQRGQV